MSMTWEEIAMARMQEINRLRSVVRSQDADLRRKDAILFQVLQFARETSKEKYTDLKDSDEWLFSKFDITKTELAEIYDGTGISVYDGSCTPKEEV